MFRSARVKLTLFYLAILLGFSLVLTLTVRVFVEREYAHSTSVQLGQVRQLLVDFPWKDLDTDAPAVKPQPDRAINTIKNDEASTVREHLNRDFVLVNGAALLLAGVLSYWFAGRTLRPIEAAHRAQARFASDASHELRTPLASMRVENEVFLRQRHFSEDEAREQIESNLEEVQRLESLSNNLLALTYYENSTLPRTAVDPKKVTTEALRLAHKTVEAREVTIVNEIAPATLVGNYDSLVQLMGILLDNALKYGPQKGTITVTGERSGSGYLFKIIDQGPGIAEGDIAHIFERLYRGDKARSTKAGGYGLGLALASQIIKANNGSITVTNQKPKGACFEVRLAISK
ncbi:MAG: sensor histidine kinase [Candidatus Saccharibacteria bacterium]